MIWTLRGILLIGTLWGILLIWLLGPLLRVGTALGREVLFRFILVLLPGVLSKGTGNRTTDGAEEAVLDFVASETTHSTTGKGTGQTTLIILGPRGGLLLLLVGGLRVLRLRVLILRLWVLLRV